MKAIKTTALSLGILASGMLFAQEQPQPKYDNPQMTNMIKIGGAVGLAVPAENAAWSLGLDVAYQNLVTPGFGLGIATGYTHYFARENDGLNNNDFGVVPAAALIRIYPRDTGFYFGTDLGYGFIVGDDEVASNDAAETQRPDGGFYIKPEIGYHNNDWNFFLQYQKVFTGDTGNIGNQSYNAGSIGVGASYNIPLGK
ncbi:hypothetical protein [Chryseobacterium sp. MFBS3-17]|uniref:hypothetical protein n=1 Tax=Chryseobacterium sp. MFBS3-17 TaxID=2886689 RepID=UPI001D0ED2EF|nr:hypothetical protein [Chryseobacterium sp. MFBS3-17]MCC2591427.1 hypothetical protein [Chryseobacterium sp. MFBS3-17]